MIILLYCIVNHLSKLPFCLHLLNAYNITICNYEYLLLQLFKYFCKQTNVLIDLNKEHFLSIMFGAPVYFQKSFEIRLKFDYFEVAVVVSTHYVL